MISPRVLIYAKATWAAKRWGHNPKFVNEFNGMDVQWHEDFPKFDKMTKAVLSSEHTTHMEVWNILELEFKHNGWDINK